PSRHLALEPTNRFIYSTGPDICPANRRKSGFVDAVRGKLGQKLPFPAQID
ncbi:hypothetical protein NPIL_496981, partial [Nephila pilipes]